MKPAPPPLDYFGLVADALHDAMIVRDAPRVREIGRLAAELVEIELERDRRLAPASPARNPEVRK